MFQVEDTAELTLKYAGRSKAIVVDNIDPAKRGRVRVKHPLLGDESVWVPYLTSPGTFSVPHIGDVVYVEADAGHYSHPIAWGNFTKQGGGAVPDTFLRHEPNNRGMYTPGNHIFEMDDGQGLLSAGTGIRLTTANEKKFNLSDGPTDSGITLSDELTNGFFLNTLTNNWEFKMAIGTHIVLDGAVDSILAEVNFGDRIEISALSGIQASTPAAGGTALSMNTGRFNASGALQFSGEDLLGAKINLENGLVAIGNGAGEVLDLFDQTLDILIDLTKSMAFETHIGNLGYPSAIPSNASDYVKAALDLTVKIKAILAVVKGTL